LILHNNYNIRFGYIYPHIKIIIVMIYTKIDEFLSSSPKEAPTKPSPTTKPGTAPGKSPQRPSPIRRDKPAADPQPKAAGQEAPSRPAPTIKPGTAPGKTPQRPSPIRRDKPAADPQPKAIAKDVVSRFMVELRKNRIPLEFNLPKLKAKYND
jgi:hypothetical protein